MNKTEFLKSLCDPIILLIFLCIAILSIAAAISGSFRGNDDNVAEEALEEVVKQVSGYDIDITPFTLETD